MSAPPRLLIVDDDVLTASLFGRVGRAVGYDVIVTDDPAEVRRRARTWQPNVIMLDLAMPGTNGIEILGLLGGDACAARILIVSGLDSRAIEYAQALGVAYKLDVAGVLQKPCPIEAIDALLRSALGESKADLATAGAVRQAIANREMILDYQPQVELATGRVTGVEALLRWQHPRYGLLPPGVFIPLIEEADVLADVSAFVLAEGIRQRCAWHAQGLELDVAVNLSARDFTSLNVADLVEEWCVRLGVAPAGLTIEITEGAVVADPARVADVPRRLPGVRLSIDDFGIGYSSLVGLRRLPVSEVKIDRSFVTGCEASREDLAVVRSIVDLARGLGVRAVAEGIEAAATAAAVASLGCDLAQGYHFAKPMRAEHVVAWCAARNRARDAQPGGSQPSGLQPNVPGPG